LEGGVHTPLLVAVKVIILYKRVEKTVTGGMAPPV
jgi:hypothetical protein